MKYCRKLCIVVTKVYVFSAKIKDFFICGMIKNLYVAVDKNLLVDLLVKLIAPKEVVYPLLYISSISKYLIVIVINVLFRYTN